MNSSIAKYMTGGLLALMVLTSAPLAQAQSPSKADLQAQINQLLAALAQLQTQTSTSASPAVHYTWTRALSVGSTGEDVRQLQKLLNTSSDTRVAVSGVGAPGSETAYYGPATAAAVAKFQVKYRSEILTPAGLVNGTGYFGPSTMAKANALASTTIPPVVTTPSVPTTPTTPSDNGTAPEALKGEGALDKFEIDRASNTRVKEAAADAPIASFTLEAKDGDIEIDRLDIALVADAGNTEKDPWDTFENISLWIDGEKIEQKKADNRSLYLNRNTGTIRFSGLDLIIEEDDEVEVTIAASLPRSIKGVGTAAEWRVSVDKVRYFDADGVATDDTQTGDLGDKVDFTIVERGYGEELKFSLANGNPDTTDVIVDESRRTNNVKVLEYNIEAIDADIELETLYVNIETGATQFADVVQDVRLKIGNKTFKRKDILTTGAYSTTSVRVSFDIDGDITIDEGDEETVEVLVDLKSQSNYLNGETIIARITSQERDITEAEGSDDIDEFSGTVVGNLLTLIATGIVLPTNEVSFKTNTIGQNSTIGTFELNFEIKAVENDFYITDSASTSISTSTGGFAFTVESNTGATALVSAVISSNAKETSPGVFMVREGETKRFTMNVTVDADTAASYRVGLDSIIFSTSADGITGGETYTALPANKYRTGYQFINN